MPYLLALAGLLLSLVSQAQMPRYKPAETREIILYTADTIHKIRIFIENPEIKRVDQQKRYTWYQKEHVLSTVGAWSGKLLHGQASAYYANDNLLEQGSYDQGWKTGLWRRWYPDGSLQMRMEWKKGEPHGEFAKYDANGQLLQKGTFRKGQLHGKVLERKNNQLTTTTYKKGKPQKNNTSKGELHSPYPNKKKKQKESKQQNKKQPPNKEKPKSTPEKKSNKGE